MCVIRDNEIILFEITQKICENMNLRNHVLIFFEKARKIKSLLDLENHRLESRVYFDMNENTFCCIMFSLYSYVS